MKRYAVVSVLVTVAALMCGCSTTLPYRPSRILETVKAPAGKVLVVADVGDARGCVPNLIGSGVSYWLPQKFYAKDDAGAKLPASFYIADCLSRDLTQVGFAASLANQDRTPMRAEDALAAAKAAGADYLITTEVTEGKTHFWGFLIIPFVQPVWTKVGIEVGLVDVRSVKAPRTLQVSHRELDWCFAKVTILDAIFDGAIFGRGWHRKAWGRTAVPDALADAVQQITAGTGD